MNTAEILTVATAMASSHSWSMPWWGFTPKVQLASPVRSQRQRRKNRRRQWAAGNRKAFN